ncbi:MAG: hypothetical protein O7J95_13070 [Planctomycetota bacterium]|nr:hypothetical protein [Planctomycetota bacterium]
MRTAEHAYCWRRSLMAGAVLLASGALLGARSDDRWLRDLVDPDPFVSERAASEIRRLGAEAIPSLVDALQAPEMPVRLKSEKLLLELLEELLQELEDEYRSLDLDRRELAHLRGRVESRTELERLRKQVAGWKKATPDLDRQIELYLTYQALVKKRQSLPEKEPADADGRQRLKELKEAAEKISREIPDLEQKAGELAKYYRLESIADTLEDRRDVEKLRMKDLSERVEQRQPAVDKLIARVEEIGAPAWGTMAFRRQALPLRNLPDAGDLRSAVQILYDRLLAAGLKKLPERYWSPAEREFDYFRYHSSLLWTLEADSSGPRKAVAESLLARHLKATLDELESTEHLVRERAALELYRLGKRGSKALAARLKEESGNRQPSGEKASLAESPHAFLASLLRWRVSPLTYRRVGIHFADYEQLPFTARRRKIFQFARTAGREAIPTLRAIVVDDTLEKSFLVKYAAAKALAAQLGDQLGYLVLKSLHPEMVMKRPEISRDLRIIQGHAFIRAKNYAAAVEEFSKILEEFPFDFEGNYHIAFAYLLLKNYAKSIHHFEIARRINPTDQLTLYNLACAYSLGGEAREALEALEASIKAGFHDAEHMENDPDLEPIRGLPRFQEVIDKARGDRS